MRFFQTIKRWFNLWKRNRRAINVYCFVCKRLLITMSASLRDTFKEEEIVCFECRQALREIESEFKN